MAGQAAWLSNLPDMLSVGLLSIMAGVILGYYFSAAVSLSIGLRAVLLGLDGGLFGFGFWLLFRCHFHPLSHAHLKEKEFIRRHLK